jgi:hypothetical protein
MKKTSIGLSTFFLSRYGVTQKLSPAQLVARVESGFLKAIPGYRDGVCLVPISPKGIFSSVVDLVEGEPLQAEYAARVPGETPRKFIYVDRDSLQPAKRADVVLYRADVLAENSERSTQADWEIVSLLAHSGDIPLPLDPDTFCANHYRLSGGTATGMHPETFVRELGESVRFWAGRANVRRRMG